MLQLLLAGLSVPILVSIGLFMIISYAKYLILAELVIALIFASIKKLTLTEMIKKYGWRMTDIVITSSLIYTYFNFPEGSDPDSNGWSWIFFYLTIVVFVIFRLILVFVHYREKKKLPKNEAIKKTKK